MTPNPLATNPLYNFVSKFIGDSPRKINFTDPTLGTINRYVERADTNPSKQYIFLYLARVFTESLTSELKRQGMEIRVNPGGETHITVPAKFDFSVPRNHSIITQLHVTICCYNPATNTNFNLTMYLNMQGERVGWDYKLIGYDGRVFERPEEFKNNLEMAKQVLKIITSSVIYKDLEGGILALLRATEIASLTEPSSAPVRSTSSGSAASTSSRVFPDYLPSPSPITFAAPEESLQVKVAKLMRDDRELWAKCDKLYDDLRREATPDLLALFAKHFALKESPETLKELLVAIFYPGLKGSRQYKREYIEEIILDAEQGGAKFIHSMKSTLLELFKKFNNHEHDTDSIKITQYEYMLSLPAKVKASKPKMDS